MSLTLKESLKTHLKAKRYNLGHLAKEANVSQATVSLILSGKRNPKYETAVQLAEAANRLIEEDYYTFEDFKD